MASKRRANGQGWVRQLPSRRWQAKFPGPDGKAHPAPQTFDTRADADAWLKRQHILVDSGTWEPDADSELRLRGYAELWLRERNLKPKTAEDYRRILDRTILPPLGDLRIEAITVARVKTWYKSLDASKPTARAHAYGLLRTILQTAFQDDLIPANPCRIRGAGNVERVTKTEVPTAVQVHELADEMGITRNNDDPSGCSSDGKYRVMTLVAAWCGLRFGELTELRRKDLVLDDNGIPVKIRVRRGVVRVKGQFIVQTPKSTAGIRDVVIPPHIRADVDAYLDVLGDHDEQLLFPGSRNGGHMAPSALYKPWYRAREQVGLDSLRWHDLRHFAATTAAQTGATLAELQGFAGHSTTQAAMRYQHAAADANERIAEAMSNVIPLKRKVS